MDSLQLKHYVLLSFVALFMIEKAKCACTIFKIIPVKFVLLLSFIEVNIIEALVIMILVTSFEGIAEYRL